VLIGQVFGKSLGLQIRSHVWFWTVADTFSMGVAGSDVILMLFSAPMVKGD